MPSYTVKRELKIKDDFKQKDFWTKGIIFINSRKEYLGEDVFLASEILVSHLIIMLSGIIICYQPREE